MESPGVAGADQDWLRSRKCGTKPADPTVECEGPTYEFAVEVAFDDDLRPAQWSLRDP